MSVVTRSGAAHIEDNYIDNRAGVHSQGDAAGVHLFAGWNSASASYLQSLIRLKTASIPGLAGSIVGASLTFTTNTFSGNNVVRVNLLANPDRADWVVAGATRICPTDAIHATGPWNSYALNYAAAPGDLGTVLGFTDHMHAWDADYYNTVTISIPPSIVEGWRTTNGGLLFKGSENLSDPGSQLWAGECAVISSDPAVGKEAYQPVFTITYSEPHMAPMLALSDSRRRSV